MKGEVSDDGIQVGYSHLMVTEGPAGPSCANGQGGGAIASQSQVKQKN